MGKFTNGLKKAMMQDDDVVAAKLLWKGAKTVAGGAALASERHKEKKKGQDAEPEVAAQSGGCTLEDHAADSQDGSGSKSDSLD